MMITPLSLLRDYYLYSIGAGAEREWKIITGPKGPPFVPGTPTLTGFIKYVRRSMNSTKDKDHWPIYYTNRNRVFAVKGKNKYGKILHTNS